MKKTLLTRTLHLVIATSLLGLSGILGACAGTSERVAMDLWRAETAKVETGETSAAEFSDHMSLSKYQELALARNHRVNAARESWKASLEGVQTARSLPDPVLTYGVFLQEVETRVGPQKHRLGITQSFPWFGTLNQRGLLALAGADMTRQQYVQVIQTTLREVAVAFARYYYLGAALQINTDNMELLKGWERILRARYTTGKVNYSDLIKVQVELTQLDDRIKTLQQQRAPRSARLIALLDLPSSTILAWPEDLPTVQPLLPAETLEEQLLRLSPELGAMDAKVERTDRKIDLARRAGYPDFTVGVDWIQTDTRDVAGLEDNGKDPLVARVGIRIPLWRGKVSAGTRQAQAQNRAASEAKADRARQLEAELKDLIFRYRDAERKVALYKDSLIPKGNQSLEAAFAAFEAGHSDFLNVLDTERTLLEFGLSLHGARADLLEARAGIDALTGHPTGIAQITPGTEVKQ